MKEACDTNEYNKPLKAATPIHFVEYHQCPRLCTSVSLAAFGFRGFLVVADEREIRKR